MPPSYVWYTGMAVLVFYSDILWSNYKINHVYNAEKFYSILLTCSINLIRSPSAIEKMFDHIPNIKEAFIFNDMEFLHVWV